MPTGTASARPTTTRGRRRTASASGPERDGGRRTARRGRRTCRRVLAGATSPHVMREGHARPGRAPGPPPATGRTRRRTGGRSPGQAVELEQRHGPEVGQGVEHREQRAGGDGRTRTGNVMRRKTVIRAIAQQPRRLLHGGSQPQERRPGRERRRTGYETRVRTRPRRTARRCDGRRSTPSGASRPWSAPRGPKNARKAKPDDVRRDGQRDGGQDRPDAAAGQVRPGRQPGDRDAEAIVPATDEQRQGRASRRRRPRSAAGAGRRTPSRSAPSARMTR